MLQPDQIKQYERDGYYIARGLFTEDEVREYRSHFMTLRKNSYVGDFAGVPITSSATAPGEERPDPLQKYPRMIHMHRWDDLSLSWMLDKRICGYLTALLRAEPYAVQT